ncbi:MAG TPA: hypothetical protein VGT40_23580, partial [Methylomirabilota bacterium]|nr:hypothetical protein [Methylomirabilota bacterium]
MTMWGIIGIRVVAAAALALAVFAGGHVHAQTRGTLVVTVSDTPDPAPTLGQVTYSIAVLNNGTTRAYNVIVTVPVPPGTQFVKCSTSNKKVCAESAGTVSTNLGAVKAHATVKVSLILKMPLVNVKSTITLTAKANGDGVDDGSGSQTTTILAGTAPVVFLPSNRTGTVSCGDTLGPATFGADTTMQFKDGLGCASAAVGLTVSAPGKTVNLNKFKIVTDAVTLTLGSVGIRAVNASNATIAGGSTGGSAGLEYFDFGVKDDGGNGGLLVSQLRVFRARSAGVRTVSDGVTLSSLLVDKATATANTTAELPGGVGIHASGITKIQNSI